MTQRSLVGHSTNLVGVPTDLLASCAYNDHPVPLHVSGAREMNKNLFEMLAQAPDLPDAGIAFSSYMMAMFGIDPEQQEPVRGERGRGAAIVRPICACSRAGATTATVARARF